MIKLVAASTHGDHRLKLTFSDGSWGVYDFGHFISAATPMTMPLGDDAFFESYFIELGALCWPNGFDLSASSLQQRLEDEKLLRRHEEAA